MMTVGSLFSGIGGLDLGLERAGMEVIWQVEIDEFCNRILEKHWPRIPRYGDITKVDWSNIKRPDLICGGFPCQDISIAYVEGQGLSGEKSGLWWEMFRCLEQLRPRYFIIENVSNLRNRGLQRVLESVASLGYNAQWSVFPASAFGAPHRRRRLFIMGHTNSQPELQAYTGTLPVGSQGETRIDLSGLDWPQMASDDWALPSSLTLRKTDGVPKRVDRLKCLGNAVVPQVAEYIGGLLMNFDRSLTSRKGTANIDDRPMED